MGETITAAEHIFRDITAPDGSPQREVAYVPGDEIPIADAAALGIGPDGKTGAAPVEDKARRGPRSKKDAAETGDTSEE